MTTSHSQFHMNFLRGCFALIFVSLLNATSTQAAVVYDVAADFSATSNPSVAWSYGYSTTLGGSFIPYTFQGPVVGIDFWSNSNLPLNPPLIGHNPTGSAINVAGSFILAAGQAMFHPGLNNEYSVYRFTAPTAGNYQLLSSYEGIDFAGPTTTDVHVLHNSNTIFSGLVNGFGSGSGPTYNTSLALALGDTVDFAVGFGSNGRFHNDSTAIQASLTIPEPASIAGISCLVCLWILTATRGRFSG